MFYEQPVIWLHVISDLLVTLAYFSIPFALIYFIRRRKDMRFGPVAWMFAGFIFACGATHLIGVVDVWVPLYKLDGIVKSFTAVLAPYRFVSPDTSIIVAPRIGSINFYLKLSNTERPRISLQTTLSEPDLPLKA